MLIEPKDLAAAIGVKYGTLRKHITRKKLFRSGRFIDTEFPANRDYILNQTDGKGLDLTKIPKRNTKNPKLQDNPDLQVQNKQLEISTPDFDESDSLSLAKKQAELKKTRLETDLKQMQMAKLRGKLMPTELVESILTINIQTIFREFEAESENIATIFCDTLGGSREHLTAITADLKQSIQKAVNRAKVASSEDITKAIKDFSEFQKRNRNRTLI